ncbi:swarming motility protein ybiA, partial [Trifolium medium]|nr:swarming motility protein ybiA [Trifolium medium]
MEILVFNGHYDAYFWVICVDKYCKVRGISESEKMALAATGMSGCALKWWRWWSPRHPGVSWNMFTIALLWRFKPEDRAILPIVDEEEEPYQEISPFMELNGCSHELMNDTLQAWDTFLLSTDQIEVPPVQVTNLTLAATVPPTSDCDGGKSDLEDVATLMPTDTVNPTSEGIGEIPILPITATKTILTKPTGEIIHENAARDQVALDFVTLEQARMRTTFRMSLNPFLDEIKVVLMSVYDNLDVYITGIQHDSRFVPPAKIYNCNFENSKTNGITSTNCLTKSMYMMLHFKVDFCCFNSNRATHNSTPKGPDCKFSSLAANTLSSGMSQTKPLGGSLFSIGCTMASLSEEFARQCCSHT